jgi:A/G-specific adenine glycosylase
MKILSPSTVHLFQKRVYAHYRIHGRDLPWRRTTNPYRILVSEVMLQQTRVERVIEKYPEFLAAFPDFPSLAGAPLPGLLGLWQGMGYNRRALLLRRLAQEVVSVHRGKLPSDPEVLIGLPGIGPYTAGAVMAFAFNRPVAFLDTNIRRVYIDEFFPDRDGIRDDQIAPLLQQTLDLQNPRRWYNALMDYGAVLKRAEGNPNRRSAHYTRQSPFENSDRQVRGMILKLLVKEPSLTAARIAEETGVEAARLKKILIDLEKEAFLEKKGSRYRIPS